MPRLAPLCLFLALTASASAELPTPKPAPAPVIPASDAPAKPLTPETVAKLLAQLQEIETSLSGKRDSYNNGILPKLRDAGADDGKAFALWLDAVKDQDFEAQGKTATDFADFRNGTAKDLRTQTAFTTQLRLQCKFLALLIVQAGATTDSARMEVMTGATAYLDDYVASAKKLKTPSDDPKRAKGGGGGGAQVPDALNGGALEGVIAKHLKLDVTARRSKTTKGEAASNPANIGEIYEKMILPVYREKRAAAAIGAAWTKRIAQETAMVEINKVPEQLDKFNEERLPELKWGQARDLFIAGQQEPATLAMVGIIKANLAHKNTAGWIGELTSLVEQAGKPAPAIRAPEAPTPVAAPTAKAG